MRIRGPLLVEVVLFTVAAAAMLAPVRAGSGPAPVVPKAAPAAVHSNGLTDFHDGYVMVPVALPTARGRAVPVAFQILGRDYRPVPAYDIVHTKPLHAYLLRDDLSGYQHLHPVLAGGVWRASVRIPDGGAYRLYADFTPRGRSGHATVLGLAFVIPGDTTFVPLPAPAAIAVVDGYSVRRLDGVTALQAGRSALLRFQVTRAGRPARLERFLGASAHASAFEALTLALSHVHPTLRPDENGTITFHVQYANRGEQRLYLQFQAAGRVRQAAFTLFVT
jgi:hypothetical protein